MKQTPFTWEGRPLLAMSVTLLCLLAQAFPFAQWFTYPLYPNILLLAVYYWSVFRPQQAHPFLLFALGLIQDVLTASLFGLHAVTLLLLRMIIVSQRRLFLAQQFPFVWAGMAATQLLTLLVHFSVMQLLYDHPPSLVDALFPALTTLLCYPIWHRLMDQCYKEKQAL